MVPNPTSASPGHQTELAKDSAGGLDRPPPSKARGSAHWRVHARVHCKGAPPHAARRCPPLGARSLGSSNSSHRAPTSGDLARVRHAPGHSHNEGERRLAKATVLSALKEHIHQPPPTSIAQSNAVSPRDVRRVEPVGYVRWQRKAHDRPFSDLACIEDKQLRSATLGLRARAFTHHL